MLRLFPPTNSTCILTTGLLSYISFIHTENGFTFFTSSKITSNADSLITLAVIRKYFTAVTRKVTYKFLTSNIDIESTQQGGIPCKEQTAFHCNQCLFRHTRVKWHIIYDALTFTHSAANNNYLLRCSNMKGIKMKTAVTILTEPIIKSPAFTKHEC